MSNQQNMILAIALSLMVIVLWQFFVVGPMIEEERQRQLAQQPAVSEGVTGDVQAPGTDQAGAPQAPGTGAPGAPPTLSREQTIANAARITIDTPSLKGSINLAGGRIDDLLLADYRETVDPTSPLVELFSPPGTENPYLADFGWVAGADGIAVPDAETVWRADGQRLTPTRDVTLTWDNGAGLVFKRTYSVDEKYMFTVRQTVDNASTETVTLFPFGLVRRTGLPETTGFFILHEGLIGYLGDAGLEEVDYGDLDDENAITPEKVTEGWLGITDKYWGAALIPGSGNAFQPRFYRGQAGAEPTYQADFLGDAVAAPAGASAEQITYLFAGAKEVSVIDGYEEQLNIPLFNRFIDWGWFHFITRPLFALIDWLFRFLGNFGLAILAVTVIVKIIFFPLANRSYASMTKMKKLQPEMQKLQEVHKEDRTALQREMMELYKREKVNPVAGCWPILIQIPVFFALYKVLFVTIEMRHAPFFGWIQDLSAADPTNLFTLFGLIPWNPPELLHLGIWPILMGITMFVQMRMNPTPPDKTQAMIFNWMPIIFTFMLARFPAGLVIYWAWNNLLSVIQQGLIMRRHGVPIELFGNLKSLFGRSKPKNTPAE